jgi:hypothetical protein
MKLFKLNQNEKLIETLKQARVDFQYDHKGVKNRLLSNIEEQQMSLATQRIRDLTHKSFLRQHRFTTALTAILLLVVGTGATLAEADVSKPGDKLHGMDQMQERLLLKLPIPQSQKAKIQTRIVNERNKELDYLIKVGNHKNVKTEAVRDSQQALNQAIEQVRTVQENLTQQGKTKQAEKMGQVLDTLEKLAQEQEQKVESLKELEQDTQIKQELNLQLDAIKKARSRTTIE